MSVIKSKRNIAYTSFCDNARKLYLQTMKICEVLPKKHYDYLQHPIIEYAIDLYKITLDLLTDIQTNKESEILCEEVLDKDIYKLYLKAKQKTHAIEAFGSLILEYNSDALNRGMVQVWFDIIRDEKTFLEELSKKVFYIG